MQWCIRQGMPREHLADLHLHVGGVGSWSGKVHQSTSMYINVRQCTSKYIKVHQSTSMYIKVRQRTLLASIEA